MAEADAGADAEQKKRIAQAAIAVIVLSYGVRATLGDAVRSLQNQDVPAEIVVVHSGAGSVRERLAAEGLAPRVIEVSERLFAGGARNVGIAETTAPVVAFLADDCSAEPGWLQNRVRAHREGHASVASALLCHKPTSPVALAAHLSLFVRRMPRANPGVALKYGASYERALFERYGPFREDMEGGEDTEFHQRLDAADKPVWRPDVRTVHKGATTLSGFLKGQFARGRRMAHAWREIGAFSPMAVARNAVQRTGMIVGEGYNVVEPDQRWAVIVAAPLIVLGNIVYAWGALSAGRKS